MLSASPGQSKWAIHLPGHTTGAGDAFHGAFSACLAVGRPWQGSLRYASAVSAICCTKRGARVELPTHERVIEFLEKVG